MPQRALRGLLDAPLEAGHDNPRDRRGKLKLARMGLDPRIHLLREKVLTKLDGLQRTSGLPEVRTINKTPQVG